MTNSIILVQELNNIFPNVLCHIICDYTLDVSYYNTLQSTTYICGYNKNELLSSNNTYDIKTNVDNDITKIYRCCEDSTAITENYLFSIPIKKNENIIKIIQIEDNYYVLLRELLVISLVILNKNEIIKKKRLRQNGKNIKYDLYIYNENIYLM
jgi:hypothetical protein